MCHLRQLPSELEHVTSRQCEQAVAYTLHLDHIKTQIRTVGLLGISNLRQAFHKKALNTAASRIKLA